MSTATTYHATAAAAYATTADAVRCRLAIIESYLACHATRHAERPQDWGFVGDLGRVNALLDEAVAAFAMSKRAV